MFKLQAINTRGICLFYIEIDKVVVERISHFNTKGLGVTKGAIVYGVNIEIGNGHGASV